MERRADTVHSVINTGKRWGASANAPYVASPRPTFEIPAPWENRWGGKKASLAEPLPRRDPGSVVESGGEETSGLADQSRSALSLRTTNNPDDFLL